MIEIRPSYRPIGYGAILVALLVALVPHSPVVAEEVPAAADSAADGVAPVSYYHDVRPLLQAHCLGCHQPAKSSGGLDLTAVQNAIKDGESGMPAIVPGKPEESYLIEQITPVDGEAAMPQDGAALSDANVAMIRTWIEQGAVDDTPVTSAARVDAEHPPIYKGPAVIASLDFSPDGKLLAIAGYHEVLLHHADGSGLIARLIGMSERIESVRFSPDGTKLAVTGGRPAQQGEVQIWKVDDHQLLLSVPMTHDSVYGASWSADGKLVAFGCTDKTVRAIDAESGDQILSQTAHDDWVLGTAFSSDGSHLVSVGRDMTAKLIEVSTQRFVDSITSITPGVLKGGIQAIRRHPLRDEIVLGGADGVPRIYRIFRNTARVIGDDANLLWELPAMPGRIFSIAISPDGETIVAGSSFDGRGAVYVYRMDSSPAIPDDIQKLLQRPTHERSEAETAKLQEHFGSGVKNLTKVEIESAPVYAVAVSPDGQRVAAAGGDGTVRLIDATSGNVDAAFAPIEFAAEQTAAAPPIQRARDAGAVSQSLANDEPALPADSPVVKLTVTPEVISFQRSTDYAQIIATAELASRAKVDVTRFVSWTQSKPVSSVSPTGLISPENDGEAVLTASLQGQTVSVNVRVSGAVEPLRPDFIQDVAPVIAHIGCNAGGCHGAQAGKNGFKLSLRGYDPIFDVRALADDLGSRRVNIASPDESLMLLKPTAAVPHEGGQVLQPASQYYEIIRQWIHDGARLNSESPRVSRVEVQPTNPVIETIGARQQFRVVATYIDGSQRDVTREAFVEAANTDVVKIVPEQPGLLESLRRGESAVLVRYEGNYAATTLTVMGDRTGFVWETPPAYSRIDELVADKLQRTKTLSSPLCDDYEFIRRIYLDLTGLLPTEEQINSFVNDPRDSREKRAALIDALIGSDPFVDYWTNKWSDLLMVNRKFLGPEGAAAMRQWIHQEIVGKTPYDEFVWKVLTATGSTKDNPAASYFKILRSPEMLTENTTQLFLATRFNCNKCHDHPFERWTQNQYYDLAAYFAKVDFSKDPASGDTMIGATDVDAGKPLYEVVADQSQEEVRNLRTGAVAEPRFPFECEHEAKPGATRREQIAAWIVSPDNPYFAKSYVNRIWGYLTGRGLIEPLDDIRAGNPPSNPDLLNYLTDEFKQSGFDTRHLMTLICKSRTYQLSIATNSWNEDDDVNYSHAVARRLPAEVLYDAIYAGTGSLSMFPNVPPGTRAAALPDVGVELPDGFLATLGRPPRESVCECERVNQMQLGPIMALVSGPTVGDALTYPGNAIARLVEEELDDSTLVNKLFVRFLNRPAKEEEVTAAIAVFQELEAEHRQVVAELEAYTREIGNDVMARELDRQQRIALIQSELDEYRQSLRIRRVQEEQERQSRIAAANAAMDHYESRLPTKLAAWEAAHRDATPWHVLDPIELEAPLGARLTRQVDHSILADQDKLPGVYRVFASLPIDNVTGIRLEALTDDRLPNHGPGRSADGNFVLSEVTARWAPIATKSLRLVRTWEFSDSKQSWQTDGAASIAEETGRSNVFAWERQAGIKTQLAEPAGSYVLAIDTGSRPGVAVKIQWTTGNHSTFDDSQSVSRTLVAADCDPASSLIVINADSQLTGLRICLEDAPAMLPVTSIHLCAADGPTYVDTKLTNPLATFNQESHDVSQVVDGVSNTDNTGWGIAGRIGEDHVAVLQPTEPLLNAKGRMIELSLFQNYVNGTPGDLLLGRFRISVTDATEHIGFGLPPNVHAVLATSAESRSEGDRNTLLSYVRVHDEEYRRLRDRVKEAQQPLPNDARLSKLETDLEQASKSLSLDPNLQQLRRSVALSEKQLGQKRLVVAQDIAWALINSPAFLYNH